MWIKGIQDEVFNDYKKPSMYIAFPHCSFKCDKENGCKMCQNSCLAQEPTVYHKTTKIIERYLANPITHAIVCSGLDPLDSFLDVLELVRTLREVYKCNDDVVIYTGYTEEEFQQMHRNYVELYSFPNVIIKFGRFRPNEEEHFDDVLGVKLASSNQYARRVSYE